MSAKSLPSEGLEQRGRYSFAELENRSKEVRRILGDSVRFMPTDTVFKLAVLIMEAQVAANVALEDLKRKDLALTASQSQAAEKRGYERGKLAGEKQTLQALLDVFSRSQAPKTPTGIRAQLMGHIRMVNEAIAALDSNNKDETK